MRRITKTRIFFASLFGALCFAGYIAFLYQQLEKAFQEKDQFIPTRIYSDVTRITPPQERGQIEERLQSLAYGFEPEGNEIRFTLHSIDYPSYLLPDGHPILEDGPKAIQLTFDGESKRASLASIQMDGNEIPDLYLEPELVATLSRNSETVSKIRALVKFRDIPAPIWKAIIAIEDQHFLDHNGLDPRGIARALWVNAKSFRFAQGGSTITQQLVKNLMARKTKNIFKKINELFLALILEAKFEKEEILERYLNEVYLGQIGSLEVLGVAEGAEHFFGKRLEELNLAETAMMAGLIRGPGYYSPYRHQDRALERQRLVLRKMVETGHIAQDELESALQQPIRLAPPPTSANKAPYFTDFVKAELIRQLKDKISEQEISSAGFRVYTTLDVWMNNAAQRAVTQGLADLEKRIKAPAEIRLESALAAVDHSSGYIRALIGGRNYAESTFNRILNMKRQVGSTFKPFVYLSALQKGVDGRGLAYGPGYPVEDEPWTLVYDNGRQKWKPRNYEPKHKGWISMRTALAHSVNVPAAKLGAEVGIAKIIETARVLGVESPLPEVPSLSLGVAELSPVELLQAYATLANHGIQDELTVIRGITTDDGKGYARFVYHPKEAFPQGPVDLLTDMMQSVFVDGTAQSASAWGFDRPAAGKTGTTSHYRDAWFAGYTPQLTAVVWVGTDQNIPPPSDKKPKKKDQISLTGTGSALPIWVGFMKEALKGEPPLAFQVSPYLNQVRIDRYSGKQASWGCPDSQTVTEKYISGREPAESACENMWPPSVIETEL